MIVLSILATVLFVIVTILLSILSVPAALLDPSGKSYLWLARIWSRSFLILFGIRVKVSGLEHLDKADHYVYVANHSSYTDIPLLIASIPDNIRLILRSSLTKVPIWGWALLVSPFLIIDRSSAAKAQSTLAKAVETIRRGASVLLFPEGTRTSDGEMQSFKRGAFRLAFDSQAKIAPVAIIGSYQILSRHAKLPQFGMRAEVRIGAVVDPETAIGETPRAKEIDLMNRSENSVRNLVAPNKLKA